MNILLSIRPPYAEAIMAGRKLYEFRRRRFRSKPDAVVVYATAPIQRVIGWFTVDDMIETAPEQLWARFGSAGCIGKGPFDEYYTGAESGIALKVGEVFRLTSPLRVEDVTGSPRPPQAFQFLTDDVMHQLQASNRRGLITKC